MRVGMIGLDTSHVVEFARIFRDARGDPDLQAVDVVAGFPGGTDLPISRDRVCEFTNQMSAMGVEIVDTIGQLLERVDAVMLESVDGRVHLQQAIPAIESGLPLFIDKPLACSLEDAWEIQKLARQYEVPCFSSSCLRFSNSLKQVLGSLGDDVIGANTWGPCHLDESTDSDLLFYGIHGIEALMAIMGRGCQRVQRVHLADVDLVTGVWDGGRLGTFRGIRTGHAEFGATIFGDGWIESIQLGVPYRELCIEIARFFRTRIAPVDLDETLELIALLEAANRSKQTGGMPIDLASNA